MKKIALLLVFLNSAVTFGSPSPPRIIPADGLISSDHVHLITLPYVTDTAAVLGTSQTFSASDTFSASGSALLVPNGNVGIGTTAPDNALHISGTLGAQGLGGLPGGIHVKSTNAAGINIDRTGITNGAAYFLSTGGSNDWGFGEGLFTTGSDFTLGLGTIGTPYVTVLKSNGNVGIGTLTPSSLLQVSGTATAIAFVGPLTGNVIGNISGTTAAFTGASSFATSSGNVGIGTTAPSSLLQVTGRVKINSPVNSMLFNVKQSSNTIGAGAGIAVESATDDSVLSDFFDGSIFRIQSTFGSTGAFKALGIFTSDLERIRILTGGNVGIGTTAPVSTLEVNGVLTVDGAGVVIGATHTPADNAVCTAGTLWWDTGFLYLCTASGTVKRAALSTF